MKIGSQPPTPTQRPSDRRSSEWPLWILLVLFAGLFCWRVLATGYLPDDDALRHAAKVVSGKSWGEILVLRPEITIDHNPGWHLLLRAVESVLHWDVRSLVVFSVVALFLLITLAPLPWVARPECWLSALAGAMVAFPYLPERLMLGRPLLITMAVMLALLLLWKRKGQGCRKLVLSVILFALAGWVHGSWYLLVLIPIAFAFAQSWRSAILLALCWAGGSLLAAILTGHPWTFLRQSASIPFLALGQSVPPEMLVREFEPFNGGMWPAILVIAIAAARAFAAATPAALARDPVLWLAILGWLLGFRIARFWLDWGLPALVLWLAQQSADFLSWRRITSIGQRAAILAGAGLVLVLGPGADTDGRWSHYGKFACLHSENPADETMLPETGGILYSVDMSVFYHTFFCNPDGRWQYALGFEPTFMTAENLAVYEQLCVTRNAVQACAPWVQRMTRRDRLFLQGPPQIRPAIPQLEWFYAGAGVWVGRKQDTAERQEPQEPR